jgi:hypothetical protein
LLLTVRSLQPTHDDEKTSNFAPPLTEPRLQGAVTAWPISSGFSWQHTLVVEG